LFLGDSRNPFFIANSSAPLRDSFLFARFPRYSLPQKKKPRITPGLFID